MESDKERSDWRLGVEVGILESSGLPERIGTEDNCVTPLWHRVWISVLLSRHRQRAPIGKIKGEDHVGAKDFNSGHSPDRVAPMRLWG